MKICFIVYNFNNLGGIEKINNTIISELLKRRKDFHIDLISICGTSGKEFFSFDSDEININYLFDKNMHVRKDARKIKNKLEKAILSNKYDVVISGDVRTYCAEIKRRHKDSFKLILWEHFNSFISFSWYVNIGRRYFLKYADKIILLTEMDKDNYIRKFGYSEKIIRIYNITTDPVTKESYDVSSKKILSVGRIVRQKGFDYAIEIGVEVFNKHPDWSWHIYGSGDEKYLSELRSKIKKLKLENNIFFIGAEKNMNSIYPQYSFFCLTSRLEGFVLVLLEALNHNLPLISFDCPCGPNEIISDNVNGYLIPCFDIKAYQDKLNYLIENPEVRIEFSKNCEKSRSEFDIDKIMNQWIQLLDSLA